MTALVLAAALAVAAPAPPQLTEVRISNGDTPFAGDHALLTTVTPNGDAFRDRGVRTVRYLRR